MDIIFETTFIPSDSTFDAEYSTNNGDFNTNFGSDLGSVLRPATETRLGGIKVGENLIIADDGTLSVDVTEGVEDTRRPVTSKVVIDYVGVGDEPITNLEIDKILGLINN